MVRAVTRAVSLRERLSELHPRRFFGEVFAASDARAAAARASREGPDYKPAIVAVFGATMLVLLHYFGQSRYFEELLAGWAETDPEWAHVQESPRLRALYGKAWWSGFRVLGYLLLPALLVKLVLRERLAEHGLGRGKVRDHLWIYGVALLIVLPMVGVASFEESFQRKYPMYHFAGESWTDFLLWEAMYAAQFFALEFFFRGHWLRSFEPVMGGHAITAMVIPYCMIHFGKPWPEALGAIAAGYALGALALRSRSILPGFFIHVTVGVTMDLAALAQTTGLPGG